MSEDIDNFMPYLEEEASKVSTILEIGVGKGTGSTLAFVRGLGRCKTRPRMISVDHEDYMEMYPTGDWWELVVGDSRARSTYCKVHALIPYPHIIYIDTDHTPCQIAAELNLWKNIATDKTIWLFHDTYMMGVYNPMTDAIKKFAAENGWQYEDVFTEAHGLGRMFK